MNCVSLSLFITLRTTDFQFALFEFANAWAAGVECTMTRFSAAVSDSSDDEHDVRMVREFQKPPILSPPKPLGTDSTSEEDIAIDQESDEETSEESSSDIQEDVVTPVRSRLTRNHVSEDDSDDETEGGSEDSDSGSTSSGESGMEVPAQRQDASVIPWARQVGVDAQKMHVMQTSLFRIPEEAVAFQAMNRATRPQSKLLPTVRRKHSRDSIGDGLRMDSQEVRRVSCLSMSPV